MISFENFSFSYPAGNPVLHEISFNIREGEIFVLCGASSSGKSTLLHCIKEEIAPPGRQTGQIIRTIPSADIAVVFQNPETQLVTGSLLHDLAFGMENMGLPSDVMKKRMAETVSFFGMEELLHRDVNSLSGGQKQLASLCAALMMRPRLLLLDEPVSQLDPIAAREFWDLLQRINEEFGVTILVTEHKLDEVVTLADRIALLDGGQVCYCGTPLAVTKEIWAKKDAEHVLFIPSVPRCSQTIADKTCFTPKELKSLLPPLSQTPQEERKTEGTAQIKIKKLLFSYDTGPYVLKNLELTVNNGDFICILGGNGSGKSTLLKLLAGILKPASGAVRMGGWRVKKPKIGYLPQDPNTYFIADTVREELMRYGKAEKDPMIQAFGIFDLMDTHPYDISGGEKQKVALVSLLLQDLDILLLDEPTKGLDPYSKRITARFLKQSGKTIVAVTHDLEFAAAYADRCAMLFDGEIAFLQEPKRFFCENRYYTTPIHKAMPKPDIPAILYEDVIRLCGVKKPFFLPD